MANKRIVEDGPRPKRSWIAPTIADETLEAGRGTNKTSNNQAFDGHFPSTVNFATVS